MLLSESLPYADRERFEYRYAYFLPWKDAMVPALEANGADVTCVPARNNFQILLAARRLAALLDSWETDLVHCHLPIAGVVGRIAGAMAKVPVVYTEHNKQERYHWITRWLSHRTWKMQSRVVAVSEDVADSIRAHVHADVPVSVVLNGVSLERFSRGAVPPGVVRQSWGIPTGAPVIGTVAVFRVQKRLNDWLQAARQIRNRFPAVHFLVVGAGPLEAEIRALSLQLGLEDTLHFPGLQEDVRPFLAAMDIYMMSSIFEGLPVALLEAMSMECVPVCTAVGGIPEVIRSGENGYLVDPGNPLALADAVSGLLRNPDAMVALSRAARSTVEREFGMARMTSELERLYLQLLEPDEKESTP